MILAPDHSSLDPQRHVFHTLNPLVTEPRDGGQVMEL